MHPIGAGSLNRPLFPAASRGDQLQKESHDAVRQSELRAERRQGQSAAYAVNGQDANGRTRLQAGAAVAAKDELHVNGHRLQAEARVEGRAAVEVDRSPLVTETDGRLRDIALALDDLRTLGNEVSRWAASEVQQAESLARAQAGWAEGRALQQVHQGLEAAERTVAIVERAAGKVADEAGHRVNWLRTQVENEPGATVRWALGEVGRTTGFLHREVERTREHADAWLGWTDRAARAARDGVLHRAEQAVDGVLAAADRVVTEVVGLSDPERLRQDGSRAAEEARRAAGEALEQVRERTRPPQGSGSPPPSDPHPHDPGGHGPTDPVRPGEPGQPRPPRNPSPDPAQPREPHGDPGGAPGGSRPGGDPPQAEPAPPRGEEGDLIRRIRLRYYSLNELVISASKRLAEAQDKVGFLASEMARIADEPIAEMETVREGSGGSGHRVEVRLESSAEAELRKGQAGVTAEAKAEIADRKIRAKGGVKVWA